MLQYLNAILRYEANPLPQILLVQEGEPGTPATLELSCDLGHSSPHWITCATWNQASRGGSLLSLNRKITCHCMVSQYITGT